MDDEEEYPPWAGPGITPQWADQEARQRRMQGSPETDAGQAWPTHGFGGRGDSGPGFRRRLGAARARRARLQRYIWGGAAVAVAIIATVTFTELGGSPKHKVTIPGLITAYQPGEMKTVPDACKSVAAATVTSSMQGKPSSLAPRSLDGGAQSVCSWTVDAPPVYRYLELTLQAYAPSGLAPGNGSATNAAIAAYQAAMQQKVKPPKGSELPKATITEPAKMGAQAFAALQTVRTGRGLTDVETIVTRVHNVLVTVQLEGAHTGRYGPVSTSRLYGGAVAVARAVLSRLG